MPCRCDRYEFSLGDKTIVIDVYPRTTHISCFDGYDRECKPAGQEAVLAMSLAGHLRRMTRGGRRPFSYDVEEAFFRSHDGNSCLLGSN